EAWNVTVAGNRINGTNQTACVIDTGVDYLHTALGACAPTPAVFQNNANQSLSPVVESEHPYTNNANITFKINKTGFTSIAVHFANISLETPGGADSTDRVLVLDGQNHTVAVYKGVFSDVWSPFVSGDTIYVRIVSDPSVTAFGFLADQILNGSTNTTYDWANCSKVIGGWDFVNSDGDPLDDHGHGTHVSGIISSRAIINGTAPDSRIVAIKALNSAGSGFMSDVVAGIDWCVSNKNRDGIGVISMSLGTDCDSSPASCGNTGFCDSADPVTSAAINSAVANGILVAVASGNDGLSSAVASPACMANATSVGATTKTDAVASFSNSAPILDLLAPGQSICSAKLGSSGGSCGGGAFTVLSGTSMAAPHVAGVALLLRQYWNFTYGIALSPRFIEEKLKASGSLINDSRNSLVFSRVDVRAALNPLLSVLVPTPVNNSAQNNSQLIINISSDVNLSGASVEWSFANGSVANYSLNNSNNTLFFVNFQNLSEGVHNYKFFGNDSVLVGESGFRFVTIDLTPPGVIPLYPLNVSNVSGSLVNFSWLANDLFSTSMNCSFSIDGALNKSSISALNASPKNQSVLLSAGNHSWNVSCSDSVGNTNSSNLIDFVVRAPQLNLSIIPSVVVASQFSVLNYSFIINNTGGATAFNTTLNVTFPQGVVLFSANPLNTSGNKSWNLGTVLSSSAVQINVSLNVSGSVVNASALTTLLNVSYTDSTGVLASGNITNSVTVRALPVLSLMKSASSSTVNNGSSFNYSIVITHSSGDTAFNLSLNESYPQGVVLLSASPANTSGNNSWNLGNLSAGTSISINLSMNVSPDVTNNSVLNNSVALLFSSADGVLQTKSASTTSTVIVIGTSTSSSSSSSGSSGGSSGSSSSGGGGGGGVGGGGGSSSTTTTPAVTVSAIPVVSVPVPVVVPAPANPAVPVKKSSSPAPILSAQTPVQKISQNAPSLLTGAAVSLPNQNASARNSSRLQNTASFTQRAVASSITLLLALGLAFVLWKRGA
ncbi:MAG: S8 family serine peptidase, partial [Candidatus Woesearchaeota archaeon]|nr:S8 family serine peptidase [Candidatus Woesearchaeota archaeon]